VARGAGSLQQPVLAAARGSFIVGFHDAMVLSAILALLAGLLGFLLLRTKDLHSSALSTIPPDLKEDDGEEPDESPGTTVGASV
jgi:hypothetical protein